MIQQVHSWTYNLRRQNWKDTGREICTAQYDKSQDMGSNQKVHQRMGGHRRSGTHTKWNSSLGKKMNNAVFRTTDEPRNNHIRLSKSSRGNDKYPMIPCIHVILRLLPMNIFPQKKTLTDLSNKLMVS